MIPEYKCDARQGLKQIDIEAINTILSNGGLCILPSDSSYVLTGSVMEAGVSEDIDLLLERKGAPMSLAFGSLGQIKEWMDLSNKAYNFIKHFTPGGLTFVACPKERGFINLSTRCLYADGTIGIRLTESSIETKFAEKFLLPSVPIRDSNQKEVCTAEEACNIIANRCEKLHKPRKIALIDALVTYPGRLSTVVREKKQEGYWYIEIIREGAIPADIIKKVATEYKYKGIIY